MSRPALSFDQIACTFIPPDTPGQRYTAMQNTSLEVHASKFVSVVGPTGCGKSTLLNLTAGLLQPSSGQVRVFGEPLVGINCCADYMFQAEALIPWHGALDNVMAGLEFQDMPNKETYDLVIPWLARVGLAGFENHYPRQLSDGMRKRVGLTRTLVPDPDIILMDEPFPVLDIQTRQLMENKVPGLWAARRKAMLFITHDLNEVIAISDHMVILAAGPGTHPIGEFTIDLPHPRDVAEIRDQVGFANLHSRIWDVLHEEVLEDYAQHRRVA